MLIDNNMLMIWSDSIRVYSVLQTREEKKSVSLWRNVHALACLLITTVCGMIWNMKKQKLPFVRYVIVHKTPLYFTSFRITRLQRREVVKRGVSPKSDILTRGCHNEDGPHCWSLTSSDIPRLMTSQHLKSLQLVMIFRLVLNFNENQIKLHWLINKSWLLAMSFAAL